MILQTSRRITTANPRYRFRSFASLLCPPPPQEPIVTLLDAQSNVGVNLAFLLKQLPLIKELKLYDEDKDTADLAQDLNYIDTRTVVTPFACKCLREAIKGAHVVISTGGCQCKPGQTQRELFDKNLDNVRNAAIFLAEFNPAAVYCIAKPPVEALVPMVSEEYKKAESYDARKIIGVTAPESMIANTFLGRYLGKDPAEVHCPIVGGSSPKSLVPVISQTKPSVEYDSKLYMQLHETVVNAEEELLSKGSMFCYSKALGIFRFVNLLVAALKGGHYCAGCAFVAQTGHIGDFLPYMTSVVRLGRHGVVSTHMPKLNELEIKSLRAAVPHIIENILLGQTFLHGNYDLASRFKTKKTCDVLLKQKVQECSIRAGIQCS